MDRLTIYNLNIAVCRVLQVFADRLCGTFQDPSVMAHIPNPHPIVGRHVAKVRRSKKGQLSINLEWIIKSSGSRVESVTHKRSMSSQ